MTPLVAKRSANPARRRSTSGPATTGAADHVREQLPPHLRRGAPMTDARLLRRRDLAARVPRVHRRSGPRQPHRQGARRCDLRAERREPPAVGVRRRARPGPARADRRPHASSLGAGRSRALGGPALPRAARRGRAGRDRVHRGRSGARRRRGRHRALPAGRRCRRRSSPRSRTCCSPRARSASAPHSPRSPRRSPTSCARSSASRSHSSRSRSSRSATPTKPLGPPTREPYADHTHRDTYDEPW